MRLETGVQPCHAGLGVRAGGMAFIARAQGSFVGFRKGGTPGLESSELGPRAEATISWLH